MKIRSIFTSEREKDIRFNLAHLLPKDGGYLFPPGSLEAFWIAIKVVRKETM